MKIAVWRTGHIICDTVAEAFNRYATYKPQTGYDAQYYGGTPNAHIVYGILRGADKVLKENTHAFNVDRGYWGANHFDGTYRISYKGTQAKWHEDIPQEDIDFKLEPMRVRPASEWIMLCPPTKAVCDFFGVDEATWIKESREAVSKLGLICFIRTKDSPIPIERDFQRIGGVITFNSSIGWQALQRGIPVYSDPDHSIIGSYYKAKMQNPVDFLSAEYKQVDREPLFKSMRAHQFTLAEISEGKANRLLEHYLSERIF